MPQYSYKGRDESGNLVKGTMEAPDRDVLTNKLHKMGYVITRVDEASRDIDLGAIFGRFQKVRTEDMVMFNIQLSNLIHAGVSILASLSVLSKQTENKKLRQAVDNIYRRVEAGESFSEALEKHSGIFPKLLISMVKAGEASGKLDAIFLGYAGYAEKVADLDQQVRGALFYPCILLAAGIGVMLYVVTFVIPQFAEIFMRANIALPLPTLLLYQTGMAIKHYWYLGFIALAGLIVGIRVAAATPGGRYQIDRLKLKLPLIRPLYQKATLSRFARTLGMLIESGVPILQSLEIVRDVVGNEVLARIVTNVRQAVEKGEKLSEPLQASGEFPADMVQMISIGEETGTLDEMLYKVSDFYDRAVGYAVKKLTTILEPLLLVLLGGMVGLIMASMLLPIFDMMKVLRH